MKQVYMARDAMEAHWVKGELQRVGIRAAVLGELLSRAVPEIPFTHSYPTVHVNEADEELALDVIANLQQPPEPPEGPPSSAATASPWTCPACGETIEPQFTQCWNCGAPRPG